MNISDMKKSYAALDLAHSHMGEIIDFLDPCDDSDATMELHDIFEQVEAARDDLEKHVPTDEKQNMNLPACSFEPPVKERQTPPARLNYYKVVGYAPTARTMHKFAHVAIVDVTRGNTAAQYAVVNWWPALGHTWHASEYCRTIAEAVEKMGARV